MGVEPQLLAVASTRLVQIDPSQDAANPGCPENLAAQLCTGRLDGVGSWWVVPMFLVMARQWTPGTSPTPAPDGLGTAFGPGPEGDMGRTWGHNGDTRWEYTTIGWTPNVAR
ncbi:hypothetical protein NPX13_g3799 [Xylaria arbuscula]|uniref:Uncharacterized protein n=1 Tax=Xylaria arbuscula TaxID=114810 RepID=A0A9W8NHK0_9PEZI|nr:hypothetical protein NPX13_g3799 [Xylaria arbuscula]